MSADPAVAGTTLADYERIIERGLETFVQVGRALAAIRDGRLYRAEFETFEAYCQQRWGFSRPRAYELIDAAGRIESLSAIADTPLPVNEGQTRELRGLPADAAAEVMRKAHDDTDGKLTAAAIRQARDAIAPKPAPDPWPPTTDTFDQPDPLADKIAVELDSSDWDCPGQLDLEHAEPETVRPNPAVTEYLESAPGVADSGYVRRFVATLARADDFLSFDPERLADLLNEDETAAVARFAASVQRFADTLRRGRSGLRVITGGHQ